MSMYGFPKRGAGYKQPLRTVKELADEFGVDYMVLSRALVAHSAPKRIARHSSSSIPQRTYYDANAVRAWWAARKDKETK